MCPCIVHGGIGMYDVSGGSGVSSVDNILEFQVPVWGIIAQDQACGVI